MSWDQLPEDVRNRILNAISICFDALYTFTCECGAIVEALLEHFTNECIACDESDEILQEAIKALTEGNASEPRG